MTAETPLESLPVLIFDCQATGPNPEKNFLLEAAWKVLDPDGETALDITGSQSCLVKSPPDAEIPWRIERLTGIGVEQTACGVDEKEAWVRLMASADLVRRRVSGDLCPMVIHYARFEDPFLRYLHRSFSPDTPFPFDIYCTHEIALRLWPNLPRRGLRALSGFLGFAVDELRRSSHHVRATKQVWDQTVRELRRAANVRTGSDLRQWLSAKHDSKRNRYVYPMEKEKRVSVPDRPGVYYMLRANGDILYVGKATSLKQRVNSYFQKQSGHAEATLEMLSQARDIRYDTTATALEAALLETDEIKAHSPPYNKALREENREIAFACDRLQEISARCDGRFRIGPFPSSGLLDPLVHLLKLLEGPTPDTFESDVISQTLGIPPDYAPDPDCFLEGLSLLKREYAGWIRKGREAALVVRLGRLLHLRKLEEEAIELSDDHDDNDEYPEEDRVDPEQAEWTAERVFSHLEGLLRGGARSVRRAAWFCRLCDSVVVWSQKGSPDRRCHYITLSGGRIEDSGVLRVGQEVPFSSPPRRSRLERMEQIDIACYDRLRVLTTELKRLAKEQRLHCVEMGPHLTMDPERAGRALEWV